MKKKVLLIASTAVLTLGVLAACGDQEIEEPTFNEQEFELETDQFNDESEIEGDTEETPTFENNFSDTDNEIEIDESEQEEFELELEIEEDSIESETQG